MLTLLGSVIPFKVLPPPVQDEKYMRNGSSACGRSTPLSLCHPRRGRVCPEERAAVGGDRLLRLTRAQVHILIEKRAKSRTALNESEEGEKSWHISRACAKCQACRAQCGTQGGVGGWV